MTFVLLLSAVMGSVTAASHAAAPQASITALPSAAPMMAPYTLHVHALASDLGHGSPITARYEWDFGDPDSGPDNTLIGWNAAHTYDAPGQYVVRLRITNERGKRVVAHLPITVPAAQRTIIHIAPHGHDSNPGTAGAPIRTVNRAQQMLGDNVALLFKRGATYSVPDTLIINNRNVLVGAYGPGEPPTLRGRSGKSNAGIITLFDHSENVVIERLRFDTAGQAPTNAIIRGVRPSGANITVRRCEFDDVSYAVNAELSVRGLFLHRNYARVLGAYFVWGVGSDHVYLRNTVDGSLLEHNIRLGGVERCLIARNDLTNTIKTTVWAMLGRFAYIAENDLHRGRVIVGPDYASGAAGDRMLHCVAEGNWVDREGFIVYAGAEHVMLRNNVVEFDGGVAFSIWGWDAPMQRRARDVRIYHNTAVNNSWWEGSFVRIGDDAKAVEAQNNLYCAPNLNSNAGSANVYCNGSDLRTHHFRANLWSIPAVGWACHRLASGGVAASGWAGMHQTQQEKYRAFSSGDLNEHHRPMFDAVHGSRVRGVHVDFNGRRRPANGPLTIGAIEVR